MIFRRGERIIRTGADYHEFRHDIWYAQEGRCDQCKRYVIFDDYFFQVHHIGGRGMGGSKRNDVPSAVRGLCLDCHRKEHDGRHTAS